ncbi:carbohydrate sulfotransferase 9-like [Rhinophrynus dorsalis]
MMEDAIQKQLDDLGVGVTITESLIYRHRNNVLHSVCIANNLTSSSGLISKYVSQRLFVEHNHKFIYCEVPKVGCSNWKRLIILLKLDIDIEPSELQHEIVHKTNFLKRLSDYPSNRQREMLKNYTKVMFTRDPFHRLVSGYRDKLLHSEPYYGTTLVNMIKSKFRHPKDFKQNVTFEEFILYILQEDPKRRDKHWKPMFELCDPCNIKYDILGKFETMAQDAEYVLKTIGAPKHVKYPSLKHYPNESRTNDIISRNFIRDLPPNLLKTLFKIYHLDFSLFEYNIT